MCPVRSVTYVSGRSKPYSIELTSQMSSCTSLMPTASPAETVLKLICFCAPG